jgi:hypothetical protein
MLISTDRLKNRFAIPNHPGRREGLAWKLSIDSGSKSQEITANPWKLKDETDSPGRRKPQLGGISGKIYSSHETQPGKMG